MKHHWKITSFLLLLFICAQLIGLKVVSSYVDTQATREQGILVWKNLPAIAGVQVERPDIAPQYSVIYITLAILLGTILILAIIRFKQVLLWKLWFFAAMTTCLHIALAAFLPTLLAFLLALIFATFKVFKPNLILHNISELFVYGGLAAIFVPILNIPFAFLLLIILSLYDMYAVWHSKHMITLATFQTNKGIFAGLLIPYQNGKPIAPTRIATTKTTPKLAKTKPLGIRTAVLGGGDIGFPLLFSGTVLIAHGFPSALLTTLGATLSLFTLLLLGQKNKFYPAMPFLTLGCALGFLLTYLL